MPIPPVEVELRIGGVQGVKQAFQDLDRLLDRLEKGERTRASSGARARVSAEQGASREVGKVIDLEQRKREHAAQAGTTAVDREGRESVKSTERSERERTKTVEQQERYRQRVRLNTIEIERRAREQANRAEERSFEQMVRRSEQRARAAGSIIGGGVSAGIGTAARLVGAVGGVLGGISVVNAVQGGIANEARAGLLVRGAVNTGGMSRQDVLGAAKGAAVATGGKVDDILEGLDMFVRKTGDLEAANKILSDMAKLSAATGTNFADMGNTAAEVFNQLGDTTATMGVLRALAGQGRAGAIDIKDLGQYGGRLAASAAMFSGDLAGNIESFGAIAQLAKKKGGATDVAEATEAVARLGSDLSRPEAQKLLAQYGINAWKDSKHQKLRSAEDIIVESVGKTKGNLTALKDIFGERSYKAVLGAQVAYSEAGGGKAGESAIRQQFRELKSTTLTQADVDKNLADAMTENERKINKAMAEFNDAVQKNLLPVLPGLVEKFTALVPHLSRLLEWLAKNPWTGLGAVIGAAITADIAKATVGAVASKAVEALILRMLGGGGAGGAVPGAAGAVGAVGSAGAPVLAHTAAAAVIGYGMSRAATGTAAESAAYGKSEAGRLHALAKDIREGKATPESGTQYLAGVMGKLKLADSTPVGTGGWANLAGGAFGVGSGPAQLDQTNAFARGQIRKELDAAIADVKDALGDLSKGLRVANIGGDGRANPNDLSRQPITGNHGP